MNDDRKFKILIIDDDEISRSMLRFLLSNDARYDVTGEAEDGQTGIDMTERLQPDAVCLDVNLPDGSGLDILKRLKAQWPRIAVLMVTGSDDRESVLAAVQGGADGYIVKPFNPATLLRTVEQALA